MIVHIAIVVAVVSGYDEVFRFVLVVSNLFLAAGAAFCVVVAVVAVDTSANVVVIDTGGAVIVVTFDVEGWLPVVSFVTFAIGHIRVDRCRMTSMHQGNVLLHVDLVKQNGVALKTLEPAFEVFRQLVIVSLQPRKNLVAVATFPHRPPRPEWHWY